jgi:hypothetical protein
MMQYLTAGLSVLALVISATTLWLTYLRRGRLRMTTPTVIGFAYDTVPKLIPKIFLRTLLHSTAAQGQVIEGMYATLSDSNGEHVFSTWGYTESEKLFMGSGVYVSRSGLAANHHFLLPVHEKFAFVPDSDKCHLALMH